MSDTDADPIILNGPSPLTTLLNGEATFCCYTFNVDIIYWSVDENYTQTITEVKEKLGCEQINGTTIKYNVLFEVDDSNIDILNNSQITCLGLNKTGKVHTGLSQPALLLIQGRTAACTCM